MCTSVESHFLNFVTTAEINSEQFRNSRSTPSRDYAARPGSKNIAYLELAP